MKNKKYSYLALMMAGLSLQAVVTSCDDLFEPAQENHLSIDYMYSNPNYALGVLDNAYLRIPSSSYSFNDVATDDAVSNDAANEWRKIVSKGGWTSSNNPAERWRNCRAAIQYLNLFLSRADQVAWNADPKINSLYLDHFKGEAYGFRALYTYYLLQAHGGVDASGNLLGIPVITEPEDVNSQFNVPRQSFADCVKAIYADLDRALELLPTDYADADSNADVPARYQQKGVTAAEYTRTFGSNFQGRMSGRIAEAVRAQVALLAASPAFNVGTYADAARYAAQVLNRIGGVSGMDPLGNVWYAQTGEIDEVLAGADCPAEVLWRTDISEGRDWESSNFAPTLYGNGRINPTQNLVDAFPMANGYPVTDPASGYDPNDPYANRDPRLALAVVLNGSKQGTATVNTQADGTDNNALNKELGHSTRTGYYLRKLLREDVNLDPSKTTNQKHYTARIRYTELFLDYAEAANEAYGPTATGEAGFSAYDVIKAIRQRAGIDAADLYLESVKDDKDQMRQLIRNERRLELCFEGHRFWDLRRWNAPLNETARGISITGASTKQYQVIDVETREFDSFMIYGPIPYEETLKFSNLQQNKGW